MSQTPARRIAGQLGGVTFLALLAIPLAVPGAAAGEREGPSGRPADRLELVEVVGIPPPRDAVSPAQLAEIRAAIAAYEERKEAGAGAAGNLAKAEGPLRYPFFPQAGILGRDLFLNNYTDQDPSPGLFRDFDCSDYAYDGHHGHDSLIRSFREQAIGVPVFAVLPGVVVDAHDGEPDMNIAWDFDSKANFVAIDHGGGYTGLYLHLRRGSVAVAPGQAVQAGTQLGLTGSSGVSSWPHLHFETWKDGQWIEPSAGPCRMGDSGDSLWAAQPPVARDFYVADFFMSPGSLSIPNREAFLLDPAPRRATFLRESQVVSVRLDLRNVPAASLYRARFLTPRGKVAQESSGVFGSDTFSHLELGFFQFVVDLNALGTWRFQLEINGGLVVNAPFQVVGNFRQIKNRPPNRIKTRLTPARPVEGQVLTCEVLTSLVMEDPDYDVVSYRYEWRVGNRKVRTIDSAALTDLLPAGTARARDRVSCRVTVSDGRRRGRNRAGSAEPAALAAGVVEEP